MIKRRNFLMGLLVFIITLIGLIVFAELYQEEDSIGLENNSITAKDTQQNLDIAIK